MLYDILALMLYMYIIGVVGFAVAIVLFIGFLLVLEFAIIELAKSYWRKIKRYWARLRR